VNKLILCLFFPFLFSAWASQPDFSIGFEYETKVKFREEFSLSKAKGRIVFNKVILTAEKVLTSSKAIGFLRNSKEKSKRNLNCAAGVYTFVRKSEKGKTYKEEGCIGTDRFSLLINAFKNIQK